MGLSDEVVNVLIASCSVGTQKQYRAYLLKWQGFCTARNLKMSDVTIKDVLSFLCKLFNDGIGYSAVNTARSALSLVLPSIEGYSVGNHPLVTRFLKGVGKLKPPMPRYSYTWDVDLVFKLFDSWPSNKDLDLRQLTLKLASLLAIVTAQRVQSLNLIRISNIHTEGESIVIKISDNIKTSRPGGVQPCFKLPPYHQESICVVSVLKKYLDVTDSIRSCDTLFISHSKPHKAVSNQTISRWLKNVLEIAGIDINVFSSHSYRHASTSKAFINNCTIDTIFSQAGWSSRSKVFAKFYNRPVSCTGSSSEFVTAVCSRK